MFVITLSDHLEEMLNLYLRVRTPNQARLFLANDIATRLAMEYRQAHSYGQFPPPSNEYHTSSGLVEPKPVEPRLWNKNKSRYGGTCGECFGPIQQGEVVYLTEGTRARHLTCPPQPPDVIR